MTEAERKRLYRARKKAAEAAEGSVHVWCKYHSLKHSYLLIRFWSLPIFSISVNAHSNSEKTAMTGAERVRLYRARKKAAEAVEGSVHVWYINITVWNIHIHFLSFLLLLHTAIQKRPLCQMPKGCDFTERGRRRLKLCLKGQCISDIKITVWNFHIHSSVFYLCAQRDKKSAPMTDAERMRLYRERKKAAEAVLEGSVHFRCDNHALKHSYLLTHRVFDCYTKQ